MHKRSPSFLFSLKHIPCLLAGVIYILHFMHEPYCMCFYGGPATPGITVVWERRRYLFLKLPFFSHLNSKHHFNEVRNARSRLCRSRRPSRSPPFGPNGHVAARFCGRDEKLRFIFPSHSHGSLRSRWGHVLRFSFNQTAEDILHPCRYRNTISAIAPSLITTPCLTWKK